MNGDINEYLLEIVARDRLAEARASTERNALIRRLRAGRATYSLGIALVRMGVWLLTRLPDHG
jgi:excinuclease UvrABC helicase subunit UvrB